MSPDVAATIKTRRLYKFCIFYVYSEV